MRRSERKNAEHEKRTPRALKEIDFLLMVDDEGRQGVLRFKKEEQGLFLTTYDKNHIPPLVAVGKRLTAASHVTQDSEKLSMKRHKMDDSQNALQCSRT